MNFSLRDTALSYIKSLGEGRSIERAKKTGSRHKEELEATNTLNEYQKKVVPEGHRGNKNHTWEVNKVLKESVFVLH